MASITRITIAAVVLGVVITASMAGRGSPAQSATTPAAASGPVELDRQWMFPLRKLDPSCTGRPPVNVAYGSHSYERFRCVDTPGSPRQPQGTVDQTLSRAS